MNKKINLALFPIFLVMYEVAMYLANDAYTPALPHIAQSLQVSHNLAQFTFTMWFIGALSTQFILGPLSDRFGRRPVVLIGGIVFLIASAICSFSPNILVLYIGRFFQGLATPSMIIAGYAAIHESLEKMQAIHTIGRMQSVTILAPSLGPLFGGILLVFLSWHWIFAVLGIWAAIAIFMLFQNMPETLPKEKRQVRIDVFAIGKQYFNVIKNPTFMRNTLSMAFVIGSLCAWMLAGPFVIANKFHHGSVYYGLTQTFIFCFFIIGAQISRKILKEDNLHQLPRVGFRITLVGAIVSLLLTYFFPDSLFGIVISLIIISFGAGLGFPILNRLAIESSEEPMGIRMTILSGAQILLAAVGSGVVAIFYNGTLISIAIMVSIFTVIGFLLRIGIAE